MLGMFLGGPSVTWKQFFPILVLEMSQTVLLVLPTVAFWQHFGNTLAQNTPKWTKMTLLTPVHGAQLMLDCSNALYRCCSHETCQKCTQYQLFFSKIEFKIKFLVPEGHFLVTFPWKNRFLYFCRKLSDFAFSANLTRPSTIYFLFLTNAAQGRSGGRPPKGLCPLGPGTLKKKIFF